jgi:hypothetical protein
MMQRRSHDHSKPYVEQDLGEIDSALFTQQPAEDGKGMIVAGTCPRCYGRTETMFPWARPGTGVKGALDRLLGTGAGRKTMAAPEPLFEEVHFCECGHAHPQAPPDTAFLGCGAIWRISR